MQRPFSRLAIVNRGEAAMRVIHAVRELNEQRAEPIRLIALYTEPERDAMFVRHADEALCLGPAPSGDGDGARRSAYLDYRRRSSARSVRPAPTPPGSGGASSPSAASSRSCASGSGSSSSAPTPR